ncbi:MAG TPA: NUDIX domain-containing protein [Casimicrobiaceae bacterium]|nr:NUDIX domain-containing protein [Casimicrobiaceae bacterium]
MPRAHSAGIVLHRRRAGRVEILLVHPGGPFWARKDAGAWSIPKGEIDVGEAPQAAAIREFAEELGSAVAGALVALPPVAQSRNKTVHPFAVEGDLDAHAVKTATISLEWPPGSGAIRTFPEIDRAAWFTLAQAREKILRGQQPILDALIELTRAAE